MTTEEKDRIASARALERDRHVCRIAIPEICGGRAGGVHHIYPRGVMSLRWLQLNLLSTCQACHEWAHGNPTEMLELVRDVLLSAEEWEELQRRRG